MPWRFCNIREVNKRYKQKELRNILKIKTIGLASLIETGVKEHKAGVISNNIVQGWVLCNNYSTTSNGRIWIIWDSNIYTMDKKAESSQLLHCEIRGRSAEVECDLTIIYRFNTNEQRKYLWETLKGLALGITKPQLVLGDFNSQLYPQERLHGNSAHQAGIEYFVDCIQRIKLNELSQRGDYYTWANKQQIVDTILSRIDRAFGNSEQMMKWCNVKRKYGMSGISDHAPMLLPMEPTQMNIKSPFTFFNIQGEHNEFEPLVEGTWQQLNDSCAMRAYG